MNLLVRYGLVGVGVALLVRILLFIFPNFLGTVGTDLNLFIVGVFTLVCFVVGALVGWIVEKSK